MTATSGQDSRTWRLPAGLDGTVQRPERIPTLHPSLRLVVLQTFCLLMLALAARSHAQAPLDTDQCPDVTETDRLGINGQREIRLHICRMTNGVVLNWKAQPGETYRIHANTQLADRAVAGAALWETNSPLDRVWLAVPLDPPLVPLQFYRVELLDTTPPGECRRTPCYGGIGYGRTNAISFYPCDDGPIDTNSITVTFSNLPPMKLSDPRLAYADNRITYQPPPDQPFGASGQQVFLTVSVADIAGNQSIFPWQFELEKEPITRSNVVLVSNIAPGLVLITNVGDTFIFSFTGPTSGLSNGLILVSPDLSFPYKRAVVSVLESNQQVQVVTTNVTLADCLRQGSVQFDDDFLGATFGAAAAPALAAEIPGRAPAPPAACCSLPLEGTNLISIPNVISAQIQSGHLTVVPQVSARGNFGPQGLEAMDLELGGPLVLDLVLRATAQVAGDHTQRVSLASWGKVFAVDRVGSVPAFARGRIDVAAEFQSSWQTAGSITAGYSVSNFLSFGAMLRSNEWKTSAVRFLRMQVPTPSWETNLSAQIRVCFDITVTLELDNLVGPAFNLRPCFEANGVGCLPPGQAGYDLFLYEGLTGTVALNAPGWDRFVPALTNKVLEVRQPIYHSTRASVVGEGLRPVRNMLWVPCGRFAMGRDVPATPLFACDCPRTDVTLTRGLYMGRFEVTQREFLDVMSNNPSVFKGGIWGTNLSRPVENVTWHDATNYCARLTASERMAGRIPTDYTYRLPTEAEWEHACRAGTTTLYHQGDLLRPGMANYDCTFDPFGQECLFNPVWNFVSPGVPFVAQPVTVGLFAPNLWGLHDMHGNVAEWCLDSLGPTLPGGTAMDPRGSANSLTRTARGGAYVDDSIGCWSSARIPDWPLGWKASYIGFRVVLAQE